MSTPEGRERWRLSLQRCCLSIEKRCDQSIRSNSMVSHLESSPSGTVPDCSLDHAVTGEIPVLEKGDTRLLGDVNLSSISLSQKQLKALNCSTKFCQNPKQVPCIQLIAGVECAARQLEERDASVCAQFRSLCADIIRKAPKPPSNLPD